MAINFPSSPTEGQKHYAWNQMYIFKNGVWEVSYKTADPFNYVVNPGFQISQQNGDTSGNVSQYYPADQWHLQSPMAPWVTRAASSSIAGPYYCSFAPAAAKPALAAGDYISVVQYIEGNRIANLRWGTANAKPIVVRFNAGVSAPGTYALAIRNIPSNRSYVTPIVMSSTWQTYSFYIPGDTAGTWASDTAGGISVGISAVVGTTYHAPATNQWNAGNFIGFAGMSNLAATAGQSFSFAQVGLYADPDGTGRAPPWQCPSVAEDYYDCLRYYHKWVVGTGIAYNTTTTPNRANGPPNQAYMRIDPALPVLTGTVHANDVAVQPNLTSIANNYCNQFYDEANFGASAAMTAFRGALILPGSWSPPSHFYGVSARM